MKKRKEQRPEPARACELDERLHDATIHLDVAEVPALAEAVELARSLIADAESVLIGVEKTLFDKEGRILCLCGEGAKTCKCGNDLTRSVLRRLTEQRARWARAADVTSAASTRTRGAGSGRRV